MKDTLYRSLCSIVIFVLVACTGRPGGNSEPIEGRVAKPATKISISEFIANFPAVNPNEEAFCRSVDANVDAEAYLRNPALVAESPIDLFIEKGDVLFRSELTVKSNPIETIANFSTAKTNFILLGSEQSAYASNAPGVAAFLSVDRGNAIYNGFAFGLFILMRDGKQTMWNVLCRSKSFSQTSVSAPNAVSTGLTESEFTETIAQYQMNADLYNAVKGDWESNDCIQSATSDSISVFIKQSISISLFPENNELLLVKVRQREFRDMGCGIQTGENFIDYAVGVKSHAGGIYALDSYVIGMAINPINTHAASIYNLVQACGLTGWTAGVPFSVTGRTCGGNPNSGRYTLDSTSSLDLGSLLSTGEFHSDGFTYTR